MAEQRYLVIDIECFECAWDFDEAVKSMGSRTREDLNQLGKGWEKLDGGILRNASRQGGLWAFPLGSS